jgi:hypothetical protein
MSRIAGVSASLPCLVDVGQVTNKKADLWQKIGFLRLSSGGRFAGADVPAREQPIVAAHLPQRTTTCQEKSGQTSEKLREKVGKPRKNCVKKSRLDFRRCIPRSEAQDDSRKRCHRCPVRRRHGALLSLQTAVG